MANLIIHAHSFFSEGFEEALYTSRGTIILQRSTIRTYVADSNPAMPYNRCETQPNMYACFERGWEGNVTPSLSSAKMMNHSSISWKWPPQAIPSLNYFDATMDYLWPLASLHKKRHTDLKNAFDGSSKYSYDSIWIDTKIQKVCPHLLINYGSSSLKILPSAFRLEKKKCPGPFWNSAAWRCYPLLIIWWPRPS